MTESFDALRLLDDAAVRELLARGAGRERVWAAWELGLRLGRGFGEQLRAGVAGEPDPGVRRHLVVMLAGSGDVEAVEAVAHGDEDDYVRSSALRMLLQISADKARGVALVTDAATRDPSPPVREESLRMLAGQWDRSRFEVIARLLDDDAVGVRSAAADLLLEPPALPDCVPAVLAHLAVEADPNERERLWGALLPFSVPLAEHLVGSRTPFVVEALRRMRAARVTLPWSAVARIAERRDETLDGLVIDLLETTSDAEVAYLVRCSIRFIEVDDVNWKAVGALAAISQDARRRVDVDVETQQGVQRVLEDLRGHETRHQIFPDEDVDFEAHRAFLEWHREGLERLWRRVSRPFAS